MITLLIRRWRRPRARALQPMSDIDARVNAANRAARAAREAGRLAGEAPC